MENTIRKASKLIKKYHQFKKKEEIWGNITDLWKKEYEEKVSVNQIDW